MRKNDPENTPKITPKSVKIRGSENRIYTAQCKNAGFSDIGTGKNYGIGRKKELFFVLFN